MTGRIGRPCREPRCPNLAVEEKRYCDKHQDQEVVRNFGKQFKDENPIYRTKAWKQLRMLVLGEDPFCKRCRAEGRLTPARVVHHIKQARDYPELAFVRENLEALCDSCHNRESQRESMEGRK